MRLFDLFKSPGLPVNNQNTGDVVKAYLALKAPATQRQYLKIINEFTQFLDSRRVELISAKSTDALAFITWALNQSGESGRYSSAKEPVTKATVLRKAVILRGLYKELKSEDNPFEVAVERLSGAKVGSKRKTEVLTAEQVTKLLNVPNAYSRDGVRDRALLALLFGGGLRISEACNLRLADVRLDSGVMYLNIAETKSGNAQEQTLPDWAAEIVAKLAEQRYKDGAANAEPLLVNYVKHSAQPLQVRCAFSKFKRLCFQAGLPNTISPHSGRATACTQLLATGTDYKSAKDFMRHSSFEMVEVYDQRRKSRADSPGLKLFYSNQKK